MPTFCASTLLPVVCSSFRVAIACIARFCRLGIRPSKNRKSVVSQARLQHSLQETSFRMEQRLRSPTTSGVGMLLH